jgi:hypothetical protein
MFYANWLILNCTKLPRIFVPTDYLHTFLWVFPTSHTVKNINFNISLTKAMLNQITLT